MIFLEEIQRTVRLAYLTLADVQYTISVKEPVSGDIKYFNAIYTLSTKLVANLEYINMLDLGVTYDENTEIENIIFSLNEIISKIKTIWH